MKWCQGQRLKPTDWLWYRHCRQRKTLIGWGIAITQREKHWLAKVLPSRREGNTDWLQYCHHRERETLIGCSTGTEKNIDWLRYCPPQTEENTDWLEYCPHGQKDRNQVLLLWILDRHTHSLYCDIGWEIHCPAFISSGAWFSGLWGRPAWLSAQGAHLLFWFSYLISNLGYHFLSIQSFNCLLGLFWIFCLLLVRVLKAIHKCHSLCQLISGPMPSALHCTSIYKNIAICVCSYLPHTSFAIEILLIKIEAEPCHRGIKVVGKRNKW